MAKLHDRYTKTADKVVVIEDRREAIKFAVKEYYDMKNDTKIGLLIAGKGHENYQILGDKKHHFDEENPLRSDQFVLDEMAKLHDRYTKTAGKVVVIEDRREDIKFAVQE